MNLEWKDATSYSQDARRGQTPPRTYAVKCGGLRVSVTRHRDLEKDEWGMWVHPPLPGLPRRLVSLGVVDVEVAKADALARVRAAVGSLARTWLPGSLSQLHQLAISQGRDVYLKLETDGDVDLHISEPEDGPGDVALMYTLRVDPAVAVAAGIARLMELCPPQSAEWAAGLGLPNQD